MAASKPKDELYRLSTFKSYHGKSFGHKATYLARRGFYMEDSILKCFWCGESVKYDETGKPIDRALIDDHILHCKKRNLNQSATTKSPVLEDPNISNICATIAMIQSFSITTDAPGRDDERCQPIKDCIQAYVLQHPNSPASTLEVLQSCLKRAAISDALPSMALVPQDLMPVRDEENRSEVMYLEPVRLATFSNWPPHYPVKPEDLARAGFFYLGEFDRVCCPFCHVKLKNWAVGDDPVNEHVSKASHCVFVEKLLSRRNIATLNRSLAVDGPSQTQLASASDLADGRVGSLTDGEEVKTDNPSFPEFSEENTRLASFTEKPIPANQSINVLANAGFYHIGPDDRVRCFYCAGTLKNWSPADDPWVEHARYFPQCSFLRSRRDLGYIRVYQNTGDSNQSNGGRSTSTSQDDRLVREWMIASVSVVEKVKEMGFSVDEIKQAVATLLPISSTGTVITETHICDAILKDREAGNQPMQSIGSRGAGSETDRDKSSGYSLNSSLVGGGGSLSLAQAGVSSEEAKRLFDENERLWDTKTCKVCLQEEVNVVFLPCGHLCCCNTCSPSLPNCPMCRQVIRLTVRAFMS